MAEAGGQRRGGLRLAGQPPVEWLDLGAGPAVVLLHGSAGGAQQWQALAAALRPARRVIAPNLLGYGRTDPRDAAARSSAAAQAEAVLQTLDGIAGPVDLVGHSFGAVVALELALALGPRAGRLALYEPNAFALLEAPGVEAERLAIRRLHARIRLLAAAGDAAGLATTFAEAFAGPGSWAALPPPRQQALAEGLRHNPEEWAAVMAPALDPARWAALAGPVLVIAARDSPAPLRAVAALLHRRFPHWQAAELDRGGHLAPVTRPRAVNALLLPFLGISGRGGGLTPPR